MVPRVRDWSNGGVGEDSPGVRAGDLGACVAGVVLGCVLLQSAGRVQGELERGGRGGGGCL